MNIFDPQIRHLLLLWPNNDQQAGRVFPFAFVQLHSGRPMNIPRFTNPHCSHEQQNVTVSRTTLFPQSHEFVMDNDKRAELDELVKANLGGFQQLSHTRKRKKHTSSVQEQSSLNGALEPARELGPLG
jgi:hypothetical protein